MKEYILKKYLDNEISVDKLATDLKDSQIKTSIDTISVHIDQIEEKGEYQISINHLIRLCDNVINGELDPIDLNTISFALITSEYFKWDSDTETGQRIETVVYDWDNPEISFDLTTENVKLWKDYLLSGDYKFDIELLKRKK